MGEVVSTKSALLKELEVALADGTVSRRDLEGLLASLPAPQTARVSKQLMVVQSLFYATGVILFAAIVSVIGQTWDGGTVIHLFLTVVLGSLLWATALFLIRAPSGSDISRGLADALLLTGSLLMITGGYIVTNLFGAYNSVDFYQAIPALLALAAIHLWLWYLTRRDLPYMLAMLLAVASVGALFFGIIRDGSARVDVWAMVFIGLLGLLSWATHIASRSLKQARHLRGAWDKPALVVALVTLYAASFGELAVLWYSVLVAAIIGVYYMSIVLRQKLLLGTASVFLVLVAVTIAIRFFADFGITISLILSAFVILGVAFLASHLSKKYLS